MSEIIWNTEEPPHKFRFYNIHISKNTIILGVTQAIMLKFVDYFKNLLGNINQQLRISDMKQELD